MDGRHCIASKDAGSVVLLRLVRAWRPRSGPRPGRVAGRVFGLLGGALVCLSVPAVALAAEVTVVGLFPNKAVVQIDGGAPRTLSVGQKTAEGVTLVSVERDAATFDIQGRRARLAMGQANVSQGASSAASTVITADTRGHFFADGQVNGLPMRFIVDTGATVIAIPAGEARRVALDYRNGARITMNTANGAAPAYRIRLDAVRIGELTLNGVDAVVMEGASMPAALLGMSFLNRTDMRREGNMMTLTKRY